MTKEAVLRKLQRWPEICHKSQDTTIIVATWGYCVCSHTKRTVGKGSLMVTLGMFRKMVCPRGQSSGQVIWKGSLPEQQARLPSSLGEPSLNMCYWSVFYSQKTKEWSKAKISFTDWSRHIYLPSIGWEWDRADAFPYLGQVLLPRWNFVTIATGCGGRLRVG